MSNGLPHPPSVCTSESWTKRVSKISLPRVHSMPGSPLRTEISLEAATKGAAKVATNETRIVKLEKWWRTSTPPIELGNRYSHPSRGEGVVVALGPHGDGKVYVEFHTTNEIHRVRTLFNYFSHSLSLLVFLLSTLLSSPLSTLCELRCSTINRLGTS